MTHVWAVENKTSFALFASEEDAKRYVSSFPASVGGGMGIAKLAVLGTAPEAALMRDAERYRWLRNEPTGDELNDIVDAYWNSPDAFDAAVDKAAGLTPLPQQESP